MYIVYILISISLEEEVITMIDNKRVAFESIMRAVRLKM